MKVRFFNPGLWYKDHKQEIDSEISRVLSAGDLILREDVERFEENLANFVGTKYAVALNSGTDALVLALRAIGVGKGDYVVVPSHTFKATAGAARTVGANVKVADMDGSISGEPDEFGEYSQIKAFIPVHIAGELTEWAKISGMKVIEDAAQALGAVKNPTSDAQCWSFYPAKILGGMDDGGAITTNDKKIADYVRGYRNHFKDTNEDFGGNHRIGNIRAAYLNIKFKYLPSYIERRQEIADMYWKGLRDLHFLKKLILPNFIKGRVWQDFIVRTEKREELHQYLINNGIEVLRNEYPWSPEYPKLPLAAKYESETLRIPCNENLNGREIKEVIEKINGFFK